MNTPGIINWRISKGAAVMRTSEDIFWRRSRREKRRITQILPSRDSSTAVNYLNTKGITEKKAFPISRYTAAVSRTRSLWQRLFWYRSINKKPQMEAVLPGHSPMQGTCGTTWWPILRTALQSFEQHEWECDPSGDGGETKQAFLWHCWRNWCQYDGIFASWNGQCKRFE